MEYELAKDKFLRGALILTIAGLMVKIIGSVNRILLSRLLGGEGIGLYQIAYPIYLLMISISAAGIPIAISILVAQRIAKSDYIGAGRVFRISLMLMVVTGIIFALALYVIAGWLIDVNIIRDARAYYALLALTPAVFFATILASFRGYFQGYQMMTPPAVSQIIEQFVRVVVMLLFAYWLLPYGLEYAAAGAAFGAVPGSITGLIVLSWFYRKEHKKIQEKIKYQVKTKKESVQSIAKSLILLALPVSCASLMLPVVTGIDMLIVPGRLEVAGFTVVQATTAFGYLAGMALPLVMMGTIPTISLAASVVPAISEAQALGKFAVVRAKGFTAMRLCCIVTLPAAIGMWALAQPISLLLYGTKAAGPSIANLSPSIFLLGMHQVSTGILQGVGMTITPMLNMFVSAAVKVFFVWELTAIPDYNIVGAAWASNINFAGAAALNIFFLVRYTNFEFPISPFIKTLAAAIIMGISTRVLHNYVATFLTGNAISALLAIVFAMLIYVVVLMLLGGFSEFELGKIPFVGKKMIVALKSMKVLREKA